MQNAGGASSITDNRIRISVASDRAHVVSKGVRSPAATSVASSATSLAITAPWVRGLRTDRGAADPAKQKNSEEHHGQSIDGMPEGRP